MATYGVLIEHDDDGYTAWAPVIPGTYGVGRTKSQALRALAGLMRKLRDAEPDGLAELYDEREVLSVEAHLLDIAERPRIRRQRLATISDLAKALGVSRQTVWNWTRRYTDFPEPVSDTAGGPVWPIAEVRRWARTHDR